MNWNMKLKVLGISGLVCFAMISWPKESLAEPISQTSVTSVRRSIATIILCGVGGAVLGISTLSFYGDPQNHVSNITTGLVLGLIGGGAYVGLQANDAGKETIAARAFAPEQRMALDRLNEIKMRSAKTDSHPLMAMSWSF